MSTRIQHYDAPSGLLLSVEARPRDLGGFEVRRLLPAPTFRAIGPFVFFDRMGPATFEPHAEGINVRPHPHIGLATLTYLYEGEVFHRDSLGYALPILPGEVNWMVAGKGIVHSERTRPELKAQGYRLDGLQVWLALPQAHAEIEPRFEHYDAPELPKAEANGARYIVVAGHAFGLRSPVTVFSDTLYVDLQLDDGARFTVPPEHEERAVYLAHGIITVDGHRFADGELIVLRPGATVELHASEGPVRLALVGGATLDGPRLLEWNFVASTPERLDQAREDWRARRFPLVPGDSDEFIPY